MLPERSVLRMAGGSWPPLAVGPTLMSLSGTDGLGPLVPSYRSWLTTSLMPVRIETPYTLLKPMVLAVPAWPIVLLSEPLTETPTRLPRSSLLAVGADEVADDEVAGGPRTADRDAGGGVEADDIGGAGGGPPTSLAEPVIRIPSALPGPDVPTGATPISFDSIKLLLEATSMPAAPAPMKPTISSPSMVLLLAVRSSPEPVESELPLITMIGLPA